MSLENQETRDIGNSLSDLKEITIGKESLENSVICQRTDSIEEIQSQNDRPRLKLLSLQRVKTFIWGNDDVKQLSSSSTVTKVQYNKSQGIAEVQGLSVLPENEYPQVKHEELLLASTLVTDAKLGRHSDFLSDGFSIKLYYLYNHGILRYFLYICIVLNLSLAIFEKPAVTGLHLPHWATITIELGCLFFFLFRFVHMKTFTIPKRFWSDTKNWAVLITSVVSLIDIIIFVIMLNSSVARKAIRWSRPLRPLFVINFAETRQIRRAFRNIRRTLPDVLNVLILFFINILIFTLMALKLFSKRHWKYPDGRPYFNNFWDSFFDLYVLVTTANHPDVMMPAFDQSRWYVLFFVGYLIICLYIFMSIFLAVIYNNYKKHLKNEVQKSVLRKRSQLARAFEILQLQIGTKMLLPRKHFNALLELVPPKRSPTLRSLFWFVLDENMDNYIDKKEFLKLADLLNVEVSEVKDRKIMLERYLPSFYNSLPSIYIRKWVQHRYFRYIFDLFIVCNALMIILDLEHTDWIFLSLFVLEIILKFYCLGCQHFFRRLWNVFDFIVIGAAVITTIIQKSNSSEIHGTPTLDALLVLRVLRLVKIVGNIERFRLIVVTLMHICPFILIYGGILFIFYYTFAIIGMELFGGLIKSIDRTNGRNISSDMFCGNILLNNTDFFKNDYCNNNFNNILNAMVVLFELTVVNQWHVITAGYVTVTSTAARIYFLSFHLSCVIIILNIFTAFVLEAFILEYSFHKDKMESAIETKIHELGLGLDRDSPETWVFYKPDEKALIKSEEIQTNIDNVDAFLEENIIGLPNLSQETDIRFHLSKNIRDVEVLLQRMFDKELQDLNLTEDVNTG